MSRDPFAADATRRELLAEEVQNVRLALYEAHEAQDGVAALDALRRMYKLLEQLPDAQVFYTGEYPVESAPISPASWQLREAEKYSKCAVCDHWIKPGQAYYWDKQERSSTCVPCAGFPPFAKES